MVELPLVQLTGRLSGVLSIRHSTSYCMVALDILLSGLFFFWNQSFISKNTRFERSILTQIGFSSNLMASGTA